MGGKAQGEMCEKHPQLEGLRYLPAWTCVGCVKANSKRLYRERTVLMPQKILRLTAERDALQQRLTAGDEELDQCQSMALMIEEKEWAEHVGKGPISSRVESAFTQLHNELSEARQAMTAADERADVLEGLLRDSKDVMSGIWDTSFDHEAGDALAALDLMERIDAALRPAEGGGDEVICLLCMDTKTVGGSGGKFPRDCPDCCGEEG